MFMIDEFRFLLGSLKGDSDDLLIIMFGDL